MVFRDEYCPGHRSIYFCSLDIHISDNYETKFILISSGVTIELGFPGRPADKESTCSAGDPGSIPGSGRSPGEGIGCPLQYFWVFLVAQLVKNPPAMWETWVPSLGWEDLLEKGKATYSSILACRISWTV